VSTSPLGLLADLDPAQRNAVTDDSPTLCILAGAGSGKTRVLTRRIAHRVATGTADAQHVLAVTFTRRAAGELRERLGALGLREPVAAGTFHGLALAQLRRWWADRGHAPQAVLARKAPLLVPLVPPRAAASLGEIAAEIEWAKARLVAPERYADEAGAAGRRLPLPPTAMATVFARYEHEKRRRRALDFDDLLAQCTAALETDAAFAASQRWRFRHLFVDEYQDVNALQLRLLDAWRGDRLDLCVVGDPEQAIYAWNGADATALTGFRRRFPTARVIRLDHNYRSSPQILAVANTVLESRPGGLLSPLVPNQPAGPIPTIRSYASDTDEAREIARALRRRAAGGWSSMAVLARTTAQLLVLERALRAAAVPYRLRGALPFLQGTEVAAVLGELAAAPATPLRTVLADLRQRAHDLRGEEGDGDDATRARRDALEGLVRLAEEHLATDPSATAAGHIAWLDTALRSDDPRRAPAGGAVELATFHAAKGLEWPVVFLAGLEQGLVPIGHATTPEARSEERRLLYVAATRARRELHCSWAERRTSGARTSARSPSPFLEALEAVVRDLEEGGTGVEWRRFMAASRSRLGPLRRSTARPGTASTADPGVLEALRSWRASTARASGVPAFVVLHDATLQAVAEARPRSREALLALPGVGPVKAERYGDALLTVVGDDAS